MSQSNKILREFFTAEQPLGEPRAVSRNSESNAELFRAYFDSSNRPFSQIRTNPTMIVGRRGSGKTDALMSHQFRDDWQSKYRPIILFDADSSERFFSSVVNAITDQIYSQLPSPMVESVSSLWSYLFDVLILQRIAVGDLQLNLRPTDEQQIRNFVRQHCDIGSNADPFEITYEVLISLLERFDDLSKSRKRLGFFSCCTSLVASRDQKDEIMSTAYTALSNADCTAVLLIDSFEELDVTDPSSNMALSGLLRSVANFHQSGCPVEMRCSIPAEAYFYVADLSSNRIKDFQKQVTLHWSAMEIMGLCASRFSEFIQLHHAELCPRLVEPFDLKTRKGISDFWSLHLPEKVPNLQPNLFEDTLPYLLRHTQLLPRHMILLLNRILSMHFANGGELGQSVSGDLITEQVRNTEGLIANQIIEANKFIWPNAKAQLGKVLPEIGHNVIEYSQLHKIFNRSGVRSEVGAISFDDFIRMLSELGAIGRLIEVFETERYVSALFEYAEPFRLRFNSRDKICIHPCFSQVFRVLSQGSLPEDYKPVYPIGARLDDKDRRSLFD